MNHYLRWCWRKKTRRRSSSNSTEENASLEVLVFSGNVSRERRDDVQREAGLERCQSRNETVVFWARARRRVDIAGSFFVLHLGTNGYESQKKKCNEEKEEGLAQMNMRACVVGREAAAKNNKQKAKKSIVGTEMVPRRCADSWQITLRLVCSSFVRL